MSEVLGKTRFAFTGIISVTCQIHKSLLLDVVLCDNQTNRDN